jgi:lysophospholipase L1-like esterase
VNLYHRISLDNNMSLSTQPLLTIVILAGLVGGLVAYFWGPLQTLWLIVRVTPFEQTISGTPQILVLGDSTGYGTGATDSKHSVAGRIGSDFSVTIKNNSVNGRTIGELVPVAQSVEQSYDLILLQIGANDILQKRSLKQTESDLRAVITSLTPHTQTLVMMSSGNVGSSPRFTGEAADTYSTLSRTFRDMYIRVAADTPLTYIDLFTEAEDDVFLQNPEIYTSIDGLHPTNAGYEEWYKKLYPVIQPPLQSYEQTN